MGELLNRGAIYLALGRKSVASGDEIPLGGRVTTPTEEAIMSQQLQREWDDYKRPMLEARARIFQAIPRKLVGPIGE